MQNLATPVLPVRLDNPEHRLDKLNDNLDNGEDGKSRTLDNSLNKLDNLRHNLDNVLVASAKGREGETGVYENAN
jgi:hypothetical protein